MARHNSLHHDKTLSAHRTEASYARSSKRYVGSSKAARDASRRYNKACRKAAKLQLRNYQKPNEVTKAPPVEELVVESRETWNARFEAYCEEYDEIMQQAV